MEAHKRIPLAVYRLQFNRRFGFAEARRLLPYLRDLGMDAVYASPVFRARPGSMHGYDIVDPNEINPDLGSREDFESLTAAARERGLGWIQDMVPNHMAFHHDNHALMDVFRTGGESDCCDWFDIDWEHPDPRLSGAVMAPFLERPYEECLERGDFEIRLGAAGLCVTYKRYVFPLGVESYEGVLGPAAGSDGRRRDCAGLRRLAASVRELKTLAGDADSGARRIDEEIDAIRRLYDEDESVRRAVDERLRAIDKDEMNHILSRQRYAFASWRETVDVINYRRFFDVNGLIALKADRPDVSRRTHDLVAALVREGAITGLRVDHIDGLRDPEAYLVWLGEHVGRVYTVVEKILTSGERLRWWPVDGTTGYDFLNAVNGLFCLRENKERFDGIYRRFAGCADDPRDLLYEKKKLIMNTNLRADFDNLARRLGEALGRAGGYGPGDEPPEPGRLRDALVEVAAALPVYRTYFSPTHRSWHDGTPLAGAIGRAESRRPDLARELRLVASVLMCASRPSGAPGAGGGDVDFTMTFQQYTGAVMAKGFEDTFLYVYNRLISLNEVGGDPIAFGIGLGDFHAFNLARSASHPHSMSATSTHDTKRGEDARARINVLSEIPAEWEEKVMCWAELNASKKTRVEGRDIPDRNDEYALYQTLVGTYPFEPVDLAAYRLRISRYVRKAAREAKVHTSWRDPDAAYESGFTRFAASVLTPSADNAFLADFAPFARRIAHYGALNSLSQTLIKICAPGVPDFYQGSEIWDLSLVDPDNRRPVDYGLRARMLDGITSGLAADPLATIAECLDDIGDGRVKMLLIKTALAARKANPYLFRKGAYVELKARGPLERHVVAFARSGRGRFAVCIVPRFMTGVVGEGVFPIGPEVWGDTVVEAPPGAPRRWRDAVSGRHVAAAGAIAVADALRFFPVGLLMEDGQ